MRAQSLLAILFAGVFLGSCSSGGGGGGDFRLIQFLENGKDSIPRNRILTFLFSGPVETNQDFPERLKIQNVQTGTNSNFARAIGLYVVDGDRVSFAPRLPNKRDRSDAGFREFGNYVVFLKAGPDGLASTTSDKIAKQQEFSFLTDEFFEDPIPTEPPRALDLVARDLTDGQTFEISRLDPRPGDQALLDSSEVIAAGNVIEPGAGGAPAYATPWQFELRLSEPIDPLTITTDNIEMFEVFANATTSGETAPPAAPSGHYGDLVSFKVPVNVGVQQEINPQTGQIEVRVMVTPLFTLVDNTRYRVAFSGNILGIDFRKQFIGENGLTGDGETVLAASAAFEEPGGLGYTTEFIVRDRPAIDAVRTLTYDPLLDGIQPEMGQSTTSAARFNTALYNPPQSPGTAVGFLAAFGNGADGTLTAAGGATMILDTGDTPNAPLGNPFDVLDLDASDQYNVNTLPGTLVTYDSREPFELNLESLVVSTGSTLQVIGVNPVLFRVRGIAQIQGTLDVSGEDGKIAGGSTADGGKGGPGGGAGGYSVSPKQTFSQFISGCISFTSFLSNWGGATFPHSLHAKGPGRGYAGGEGAGNGNTATQNYNTGTGGGGGSHATVGTAGEDRISAGSAPGSDGKCNNGTFNVKNSGIVGIRGQPGPTYGDAEVDEVQWGGSGGGAGGATFSYYAFNVQQAGGGGGGGAGAVTIVASGSILAAGGLIDATGGKGGDGSYINWQNNSSNRIATGGGGGGSGGSIVLISGDNIVLTAGILDASGGGGGARPPAPGNCNTCNAGGGGGKGYIFLMDSDGEITGLIPFMPGTYPNFATGFLTISEFDADRFSSIAAITELFHVLAADPTYLPLGASDVLAVVAINQAIDIFASSSKGDADEPLLPDIGTEINPVMVAQVNFKAGSVNVDVFDNMDALNPSGSAARDAYVRIDARFDYQNSVEAALGPFASMDRVDLNFRFNG